jgi:polyisoprenoid-binding protein YceI
VKLGPDNASLRVKVSREGVAAKMGHDLVLEVMRWEATVDMAGPTIELTADPRSLEVRDATGGVAPLTDRDRAEIRKNIDRNVLRSEPIAFRSTGARLSGERLLVEGKLTLAGRTAPVSAQLDVADGRVTGSIPLTQSAWGIKPYRGLMGALRVRDDVEVVIDARLPPAQPPPGQPAPGTASS